jgi:hypothetical protein
MKMRNYVLALALLLNVSSALAASPLVGTWILEKSENPMPDGSLVPYCTGVHGMIIYTEDGYVSVALNCAPTENGPEPADVSGRKFFYAGVYRFDGRIATHKMLNASQPELIGKIFTRQVIIQGDELILTGVNQGQQFSAYWKRAEAVR